MLHRGPQRLPGEPTEVHREATEGPQRYREAPQRIQRGLTERPTETQAFLGQVNLPGLLSDGAQELKIQGSRIVLSLTICCWLFLLQLGLPSHDQLDSAPS